MAATDDPRQSLFLVIAQEPPLPDMTISGTRAALQRLYVSLGVLLNNDGPPKPVAYATEGDYRIQVQQR